MNPTVRIIIGVVVGIAVSFVIVACSDAISVMMFLPKGTDMTNPVALKAAVRNMPQTAMLLVLAGWALGAFVGTFLAAKISRNPAMGILVGALLLTAAVMNMASFPHPVWMWASTIALFVVMTALGTRLAAPRGGAATPATPAQA